MLDTFADRWALITGASSGLGVEFAHRLAARGMHLVLTARREDRMEALARDLDTQHGSRTIIIPCDLAEPGKAEWLVNEIHSRGIDIELLVNNAGFAVVGDVEHTELERVRSMLRLNMEALVELTYRFLPQMLDRRHGAIVNVSSVAAFQPVAYMPAYAASKSFVLHFTEALWAEARDRGVTVMALCPGPTQTEFFNVAGVPNWIERHGAQTPGKVVKTAIKALGKRRQYVVSGWKNYLLSLAVRLATRRTAVNESRRYFRPQPPSESEATNNAAASNQQDDNPPPPAVDERQSA